MNQPKPVLQDLRCELGEGPVWDVRRNCLWWVDILAGAVHCYYPETRKHRSLTLGEMVGAVALRQDGGLLAATQSGFHFLDAETGVLTPIHDPEAHIATNRFNDGKVDPQGRFWAGTMSLQDEPRQGSLYMLDGTGAVIRRLEGVSISNGLAWSPDGATKFYIDTPTQQVRAFDYDAVTGELSNGRTAISIPDDFGDPDGMTIDAEGCLWIAHWDGWQVTRWDPETGDLLLRLPVPAARVTSCTFGGPGLRDLYITTARTGLSGAELEKQPLAGALFVVADSDYSGPAPHRFGS